LINKIKKEKHKSYLRLRCTRQSLCHLRAAYMADSVGEKPLSTISIVTYSGAPHKKKKA